MCLKGWQGLWGWDPGKGGWNTDDRDKGWIRDRKVNDKGKSKG